MEQSDYANELEEIVKFLFEKDSDKGELMRQILYDWSIYLTYCVGVIQLVNATEANSPRNSNQEEVLEEAERRLEEVILSMRKALINDSIEP